MEIKFRGLRTDGKGWVYGCPSYGFTQKIEYIMPQMYFATRDFGEIDEKGNSKIEDEIAIGGYLPIKPETVGQFTGLHDKNGKEIYSGDIVQHHAWDYPFEIIYHQEKARFVCKMKTSLTQHIDNKGLEVIGNLFEHPELLK